MNKQWTIIVQLVCAYALGACDNGGSTTDGPTNTDAVSDIASDIPTADTPVSDTAPTDTGAMDTSTTTPLNGCTAFTDLTAASATRTIAFAGTAYTPNCVTIAAGQTVMFSGDFTLHPLNPGQAPSRPATDSPSATPNPIAVTTTGTSAMFTFPTAGDYGFYCGVHQSLGMYGVVRVQ